MVCPPWVNHSQFFQLVFPSYKSYILYLIFLDNCYILQFVI